VPDARDLEAEIDRLQRVVRALMDRAERSTYAQMSEFGKFQNTVMLEQQVRERTTALEAALHQTEKITRALRESEAKFRGIVSQSIVGIAIIDHGRYVYTNAKLDDMFGYRSDEMRRLGPLDVSLESDRPLVREQLRRRMSGEVDKVEYTFRGRRKDGAIIELHAHGNVMEIAGRIVLISILMDITERARTEREVLALQEKLREQSTHDALTGLYNRRHLEETLEREVARARRSSSSLSVVMADLDHCKFVNDRLGHLAGDEVLRAFGALLAERFPVEDVCCRYGGEEFLVVMPGCAERAAVDHAEEFRRATEELVIAYAGETIRMTASFGVATFPQHGAGAADLVRAADAALYWAKGAGRNRVGIPYDDGSAEPSPATVSTDRLPQPAGRP
jgi:diguanylate cyclase (GGDEF)-like protein/PAS domain S-box-containing protein